MNSCVFFLIKFKGSNNYPIQLKFATHLELHPGYNVHLERFPPARLLDAVLGGFTSRVATPTSVDRGG